MCSTVFGASSGNVSISIAPLAVSSRITGAGPAFAADSATGFGAAGFCAIRAVVTIRTATAAADIVSFIGTSLPADAYDANFGTDICDYANPATGVQRTADVLPPRDEIEIDERPPLPRHDTVERLLGLVRH